MMLTFVWFFTWERPREEWTEAALRAEEEKKPDFGQSRTVCDR
jgi:oligogalacturonide transporter